MNTIIQNVRKKVPLIHNITNYVTVNDVANIILACGASPIMADDEREAEEITSICNGLNINIGTLNARTIHSMKLAGKKAKELGHTVLLDPVGAGASTLRTKTALSLLEEIPFDVVRGNISEIKTISKKQGTTKGVDADCLDTVTKHNLSESVAFAKSFAKEHHCVAAITGAIDLVADSTTCYAIQNGHPMMGKVTGTGCQLSGLMTAFITANPDQILEAAVAAVCTMGLAGEIAYSHLKEYEGNGSYRNRIIDAVYHMTDEQLEKGSKIEKF